MPEPAAPWDSAQYLRFEAERTLPCRDLVRRIELAAPGDLLDVGCGPGNSTAVLLERWPEARALGLDSSGEMLARARASRPAVTWVEADVRTWAPDLRFDLVFSNAALQWLPDHPKLVRRLWDWVYPGGALAFQVPVRTVPPAAWVEAIEAARRRPAWRELLAGASLTNTVLPLSEYYELLAPDARRVDLWDTEYDHIFPGPEAVVEWTRGTALRPWLARLPSEEARAAFLADAAEEAAQRYPRRSDGRVLFPFVRRFVVAYR